MYKSFLITEEEKTRILKLHESKKKQELGLLMENVYGKKVGFTKGISEKDFKELVCSLAKEKYGFSVKNGKINQLNSQYMYMSSPLTDSTDGKKWTELMSRENFYDPTNQDQPKNISIATWLDKADPTGKWQTYAIGCMSKPQGGEEQKLIVVPTIEQVKNCKNKLSFKQGMKGETIKKIQGLLGSKYAKILGPVNNTTKQYDGNFGPKTEKAVRQFQTDNNLKTDGIVGCNTINKMLEILQSSVLTQKPVESPRTMTNSDLTVGDQKSITGLKPQLSVGL